MVQIVTKDNLGTSFKLDTVGKKIDVNIDDQTIGKSASGALQVKTTSTAFIAAIKSSETKTNFSSHVDESTGKRLLRFVNEEGITQEVNLTDFLADVQVSGGSLNGQVLTLQGDNGGSDITIDLGVFITETELSDALNNAFNEVAVDAFGTQLFKVQSL